MWVFIVIQDNAWNTFAFVNYPRSSHNSYFHLTISCLFCVCAVLVGMYLAFTEIGGPFKHLSCQHLLSMHLELQLLRHRSLVAKWSLAAVRQHHQLPLHLPSKDSN